MYSYPTPTDALRREDMNESFFKLHPGAPVHVFTKVLAEPFHCHPFDFTSHIALGSYVEEVLLPREDGTYHVETLHRKAGTSHQMPAAVPHRLVGLPDGVCITRAEYGPHYRTSGEYELLPDGTLRHRFWHEPDWQPWPRPEL